MVGAVWCFRNERWHLSSYSVLNPLSQLNTLTTLVVGGRSCSQWTGQVGQFRSNYTPKKQNITLRSGKFEHYQPFCILTDLGAWIFFTYSAVCFRLWRTRSSPFVNRLKNCSFQQRFTDESLVHLFILHPTLKFSCSLTAVIHNYFFKVNVVSNGANKWSMSVLINDGSTRGWRVITSKFVERKWTNHLNADDFGKPSSQQTRRILQSYVFCSM